MEANVQLPCKAVYYKKVLKYDAAGRKFFAICPYDVMVVNCTENSYKIQFKSGLDEFNGRQTFVRKNSIKFNYLTNDNYCERRHEFIPIAGCVICYKDCALRGKDFPKAVINT